MTKQSAFLQSTTCCTGNSLFSAKSKDQRRGAHLEAQRGLAQKRSGLSIVTKLLLLVVSCATAQAQTLLPSWSQQSPVNSPGPKFTHGMAYDSAHGVVVVFGGFGSNDTWLWNGTNWTLANPANKPSPRSNAYITYDAAHGQVVLFGGADGNNVRLGDTWLWDGTNWTQANPATNPPARNGHTMSYDAVHGQVLLFGGVSVAGSILGDTWVWDGTNWTAQNPTSSPSARFNQSTVFDAAHGQVMLFGGTQGNSYLNDTWTWSGTNWVQQAPATSPAVRYAASMAYDAALGQVVLFGGYNGTYFNDTWFWNGTNWSQYFPANSPSARYFPNDMAYDSIRNQVLMFGGSNGSTALGETWEFGQPGSFGNVNVCSAGNTTPAPCSSTATFTYNFASTANLNAPQVLTQGAAGLDFTLAPGSTCTGAVPAGTCTVNVTFTPSAPGLRTGAIQLVDSTTGNILVSSPISGVGQGPAVAFSPEPALPLATNFDLAIGIATDSSGNVFASDYNTGLVTKISPAGAQSPVGGSFSLPQGLAVDGAGNVYVAEHGIGRITKVPPGCASSTCQVSLNAAIGLAQPTGVAVDSVGNLFISSLVPAQVTEIPAGCTVAGCTKIIWTGPTGSQPTGVSVDAVGNLFITDGGTPHNVIEIPAGCSNAGCQLSIGSGWLAPTDAVADAAGNIFVSDVNIGVVEVPAGCTQGSCRIQLYNGAGPYDLALDGQGNLTFSAFDKVLKINRSFGSSLTFTPTVAGNTSTDSPQSINLQNIGNQPLNAVSPGFVTIAGPDFANTAGPGTPADCSTFSTLAPGALCNQSVSFTPQTAANPLTSQIVFSNNALNATAATQTVSLTGIGTAPPPNVTAYLFLNGAGTGTVTDDAGQLNCTEANHGSSFGTCAGFYPSGQRVTLTAQATGSSIFTGWGGICASAGTTSTCTVTPTNGDVIYATFVDQNLGSYNVCPAGQPVAGPCSNSAPVTLTVPVATTIGAIRVVTQGATGLDFSQGSGSTCVGTVVGGTSCTVNVNFAPIAPGLRMGAVQMFDNTGNLVASAPIYGIGQEAAIAFGPGTQSVLVSNLATRAAGVAVDAAGNVYVAGGLGAIKQTPSGVQTTYPVSGIGAAGFYDVAVDGAGNIYLADSSNNRIVEITPTGVQTTVPTTGLSFPSGVKVDGAGNVFITDRDNNRVVKVTPGGVQTTVPTTGIARPYYPAIDAAGDVFFLNNGNQRVLKVDVNGIQTTVPFRGLVGTNGVAVDAAGNVYVSDQVLNKVFQITPGGVQTTVASSSLITPAGLAVDSAGDLFIAVNGLSQVVEVNRSQTPSLTFAQTNVGSTSSDSPQTVLVQNVGNQPLSGSLALNLGGNFTQNANPDCSTLSLGPGGICGESFSFTPQSATFASGTAVFSDNSLNFIPATQTITLIGTGATNGVPGTVAVPNVVGQVQAAAATPITGAGLAVGAVTTASSSTVPSGSVINQSPDAGTQVAVGSAVNLLVSSGLPQPPSPTSLLLKNNYFVTGDYVSAGVTLRGLGVAGVATRSITIPSYTPGATQGVPDGADIVDAFLYWETLENTPTASSTSGKFNGYPIVGQQIGLDQPSYVDGQLTGTLRAYRASVNAYLPVGANGVRIVSGNYSVSLPDGGTALPITEGASLVMVYRVLSPNFPLKSVVIYDGATVPAVAGTQVVQGFYDAVGGASGVGKTTNLFAANSTWSNTSNTVALGASNKFTATLNPLAAYAAVILSTPVNNSDNDGILDAWKAGPAAGDFHAGQPGYYDVKTSTWVGLPGAKHGQKDLFVQLDYMCGGVFNDGSCDTTQENLFPSPDANGNDPVAMVKQAFANSGVQLHLQIGVAVPEGTCVDDLTTTPATLCQFPNQPGVVGWKNSLQFSKLWPRNLAGCLSGGDCTTRFPFGQKDSYHYVLFGHSLAIPAWNTRYGTLSSINVVNGITTLTTADRGNGINACPARITLAGVLGNTALNGVYNTTGCADTKTIRFLTPGVPNWSYPNNTLPEPVIGLTSGTISSISGYSDLGGSDSAITLGLWLTAPNQDMSKKANVVAGTLFHEIGHTLGLSHGGLYYDTPGSYVATFEANCKPNYQSVMNYLFQLDLVGPNQSIALSNQTLNTLNESSAGSVTQLTDALNNPATFPTSAWYVPYTAGSPATPATRHCDGTPLSGDSAYRVDASVAPITPPWANGQDLNFTGTLQTKERGFNDLANLDLRQIGATGGDFASLASVFSFGSAVTPLNISAGGTVALGSGGTVALGSGGTVALGSGGNVTLSSGGTIALGSGGTVALGSGGVITVGASGGVVSPGSSGTVALGSGGTVTLSIGGTIALGSGGTVALGSGGTVALGSGGTIALGSGGTVTIPASGGSYTLNSSGGTIALGSGGTVALGSGGVVTLSGAGTIALGSGGTIALGSGGTVALGSGGTVALGSGGTVALGSGGNVTLSSGGTIALGSGGTIALGSGGTVALGSGGTVTLGSSGNVALGSGGTVALGSGGTATLGAGGSVTLGAGGTVALGSGGTVALGSGGTIALGSGGTVAFGSGGTVTLAFGGTIALGSGGTVTIAAGGTYTINGAGGTIALGSGGTVALGSGGTVTLSAAGTIALGSGGTVALGSGGKVTLINGGVVNLGPGGSVSLANGTGNTQTLSTVSNITPASPGPATTDELTYETANSVVRPPSLPTKTVTPAGVRITWKAPSFGVVQTYIIYRSSNGATPAAIGSVSGVNGNPPATQFTDTNPDRTSQTVVYTISTILVPDAIGTSPRQSPPSPPAVLKNDQSITLGPLPSSVLITSSPTVTATAMSGGVPNGLQVVFSALGSCGIDTQSIANNVSSATVLLTGTGSCTVIAAQPGSTTFNAANSVSGTFMVLPQGSGKQSQTISFATLPNAQYGGNFTLSALSSSGLPVTFAASGPCTPAGVITGAGMCSITASAPGNSTYSAASLMQSFTIYPAVLKVTANNLSVGGGQPIPALTYTYSGFVNGDTAAVVRGVPALSTTATASSGAGLYPITVSTGTLASANFSFLYVSGTLTVQSVPQAITFTINPPATAAYPGTFVVAATGGASGNPVTFSSAGACSNVGSLYTMTNSTGTCSVIANQAGSASYTAAPQVTKTVTATGPLLRVSTSSINVGTVYKGSITAQTITLTNIGTAPVILTDPFFSIVRGGNSNEFVAFSLCPRPLAVGKSCTVLIGFIAGPYYTPQTAVLQIMSNAPGSPQTVALSALVINPRVDFSPASLNFGTVRRSTSSTLSVTISNPGDTPLTLNGFSLTGVNATSFAQTNTCGASVAVGGRCTVTVRFTPPAIGTFSANLTITDNAAAGSGTQTVALTGKGN